MNRGISIVDWKKTVVKSLGKRGCERKKSISVRECLLFCAQQLHL